MKKEKYYIKSKDVIVINGLKFNNLNDNTNRYILEKRMSTDEVVDFYNAVAKVAFQRNFYNNPFEWAAFARLIIENEEFTLNSPHYINGDRNWYSYPLSHDGKRPMKLTVTKDE